MTSFVTWASLFSLGVPIYLPLKGGDLAGSSSGLSFTSHIPYFQIGSYVCLLAEIEAIIQLTYIIFRQWNLCQPLKFMVLSLIPGPQNVCGSYPLFDTYQCSEQLLLAP